LRFVVLGSAAGGGFPQWNSNARNCNRARSGDPAARPRTQASIAFSDDGERWFLINASPDLREQIGRTSCLHPREGLRSSPIAGVILTGGDVDAIAGLLTLRERQPFNLFATPRIHAVLDANPIFEVLARDTVRRVSVDLGEAIRLSESLEVELFAVPGKIPLYLEGADAPVIETGETTVGAAISDAGSVALYIPGCAAMTPALERRIAGADLVFFDGTLWRDDEMIVQGLGSKTGARMGHMSLSGATGALAAFASLPVQRKILIHLNNSNPVLIDDSPERDEVVRAGWEVAFDGQEIVL
jgi:pyrroloquinoline quinone biosynthesis protein B